MKSWISFRFETFLPRNYFVLTLKEFAANLGVVLEIQTTHLWVLFNLPHILIQNAVANLLEGVVCNSGKAQFERNVFCIF